MKRLFLLLVILWAGAVSLTHSPLVNHGLTDASRQGSIGGILVGLALCVPLLGLFVILRAFSRWQRGFHQRMQVDGLAIRRPGAPQ